MPKANVLKVLMDKYGVYIPQSGLNNFSCRASTHIYTLPSDVDRLLEGLRYVSENASKLMTSTAAPAQDE
ncbi:MAG: hypothetical protein HY047_13495 [Acidobacteria bacterium]|nr:hypothetical protein [Acidobacteriota bacterium]